MNNVDVSYDLGRVDINGNITYYDTYVGDLLPDKIDGYYWNYYYPYIYTTREVVYEKSKIEQAFKIVDVLLKQKLAKINTVKQFVDLVNKIAEVL